LEENTLTITPQSTVLEENTLTITPQSTVLEENVGLLQSAPHHHLNEN
jgi:hypothetical protein